jgi:hypothetical protein
VCRVFKHQLGADDRNPRRSAMTKVKQSAKTKTVPYDLAEQLRTPEEIAAYLSAWVEDAPADSVGIARALKDVARVRDCSIKK